MFAETLQKKIQQVSDQFPQLTPSWNNRLSWCLEFLSNFNSNRVRRAPLGFIGRLSHTLFGTITEDELNQYKSILLASNMAVNKTIHRVNLLLSATKQVQINVNKNSAHLFKLQRYLASISRTISISFLQARRAIEHIELKFKIEHALISLEQSTHRITAYYNRRKRQMNSMYHRSLSEDLLPTSELKDVLAQATKLGYHHMPLQWYYRNCKISPVWSTPNAITFRVHLPLHDGKSYLLHSFRSVPFPIKVGFKARLQVKRNIAYSSTSGSLFEPMLCTGIQDKVCRGGPLYRASNFRCERALLSKDPSAQTKCATKLFPSNRTIITEDTPGFYTVSTFSANAKLHCDASPEKNVKLQAGVYIISLNHSCTLRGADWTLLRLNQFKTPLHLQTQTVPINLHLAFSSFSPLQMQKIAQAPHWTPIQTLPALVADPLPELRPWLPLENVQPLTWINSTSIVCLIIVAVLLLVAYKLCKRYPRFQRRILRQKPPSAPQELELTTVVTPPTESAPPQIRLPTYPDLSSNRSVHTSVPRDA